LHLFGEIVDGKMILNDAGRMVENEWLKIPNRFPNTQLHEFVVMPNHFHAILEITENVRATLVVAQNVTDDDIRATTRVAPTTKPKTIGDMIGAFQSITTVEYIRGVKQWGWQPFEKKLWQRNYWEHIIRDYESFERISNYIITNPENWNKDKLK